MLRGRVLYISDLQLKPVPLPPENVTIDSSSFIREMMLPSPTHTNATLSTSTSSSGNNDYGNISSAAFPFAVQPMSHSPSCHHLTSSIKWSKEILEKAVTTLGAKELDDIAELEVFAKQFKEKRLELGLSQSDVCAMLIEIYGAEFSQATVSRFEMLNLPFTKMATLMPYLKQWLNKTLKDGRTNRKKLVTPTTTDRLENKISSARNAANFPLKQRKKRTALQHKQKQYLEEYFRLMNPYPRRRELQVIAENIEVSVEVVRTWFCNRRAKDKPDTCNNSLMASVQALCTEVATGREIITIPD